MRSDRGLSLLEALFGMLVSFMVLSAVCVVLQQAVTAGGTLDEQGTLAEVYHAFSLIRRDMAGASEVSQPTTTGENRVVVSMIDPGLPFATRMANNDAFEASERITVRYLRRDGILRREVLRGSTLLEEMRILPCATFVTSREGTLVSLSVTVELKRVVKAFEMQCRIRPG